MHTRDIQHYAESRTKARAYFCYLFSKNLPNRLPSITVDAVMARLRKIMGDLKDCEGIYLLDARGVQISPTYLAKITRPLLKRGILSAARGVGGGLRLGRPPDTISMLEVIEALQGPLLFNECLIEPGTCWNSKR